MTSVRRGRSVGASPKQLETALPAWIRPQLTQLVQEAPDGSDWLHEIKFDGYRMHARVDGQDVRLLTRTGLDWTDKYPTIIAALGGLPARQAYLDGELCGVRPDGTTSFSLMQAAAENARALVLFVFDLLYLDGDNLTGRPLRDRKERLALLLAGVGAPIQYSDHQLGRGPDFYREACKLRLEGIVSKRVDAPYVPGDRGLWLKTKCLNREEFVVVGWTDPEGARPFLGSLLLAYYDPEGRLVYAGRAGAGMSDAELKAAWERLQPLAAKKMPLQVPPPSTSRFGSPLVLSRVHWVKPELVAEIKFLTWTDEGLLRQVVYEGFRQDKPPREVVRDRPAHVLSAHRETGSQHRAERRVPGRPRHHRPAVPPENILQLLPDAVVPGGEQLAAYWRKVSSRALEHLGRRPLKIVRHYHGTTYYHRGRLPPVPDSVHQLRIEKREGGEGIRLWVDDLDGLLGLAEMGVVEVHPWGATVDDIEHPDMLVFDLDPGDGVGWDFVIETAYRLREMLKADGLGCWPKTTGGKGLHVMVPIQRGLDWKEAHEYTRRVAEGLAKTVPRRYTISAALADRPGKLFIDYLRNGRGTTAVGAYSPRARPGFPIAVPIRWEDLRGGVRSDSFTIESPPE